MKIKNLPMGGMQIAHSCVGQFEISTIDTGDYFEVMCFDHRGYEVPSQTNRCMTRDYALKCHGDLCYRLSNDDRWYNRLAAGDFEYSEEMV